MKMLRTLLVLLFFLNAQVTLASELDWLVGCWETADGSSKEVWVKENDSSLIGFSATVSDSAVDFYEVLRITIHQDGVLTYTAYPSGQSPATFVAAQENGTSVIFSNAEHDYPQEIAYRAEGTSLYATISALDGINPQAFDKQRCE